MEDKKQTQDGNQGREKNQQTDEVNNKQDISAIDEQEGNLKHGETGGDWKEMAREEEEEK